MSFRVAGARDCAPCQKWAKREGFVAFFSKNDGRRGTFEEDLQRCIFAWQAQYKRHVHQSCWDFMTPCRTRLCGESAPRILAKNKLTASQQNEDRKKQLDRKSHVRKKIRQKTRKTKKNCIFFEISKNFVVFCFLFVFFEKSLVELLFLMFFFKFFPWFWFSGCFFLFALVLFFFCFFIFLSNPILKVCVAGLQ